MPPLPFNFFFNGAKYRRGIKKRTVEWVKIANNWRSHVLLLGSCQKSNVEKKERYHVIDNQ